MTGLLATPLPAFTFFVGFLEEGETLGLMDLAVFALGGFAEVTGLDTSMAVTALLEGGVNDRVHRLPGRFDVPNITLSRGMGYTDDLWNWAEGWQRGEGVRKTVFIVMANAARVPLRIWAAERALPLRWQGPAFNAGASALAIEKLEIAHERLTLVLSAGDAAGAVAGAVAAAF